MYSCIRVMLILTFLLLVYSIGILIVKYPVLLLFAAGAFAGMHKSGVKLWQHGSAEWASFAECKEAGMCGGNGLPVGVIESKEPVRIAALFDSRIDPQIAVASILDPLPARAFLRLNQAVHTLVAIPPGGGKGTSFISTFMLTNDETTIVLDIKGGENARITGKYRERVFGHKCYYVDPFHCYTDRPDSINILDSVEFNAKHAISDAREIAAEMVERKQETGDGVHFLDNAEEAITATLVAVAQYAEGDRRSLQGVCDILASPENWQSSLATMSLTPDFGGLLARMFKSLAHLKDRELASTLSTVNRFTRFLNAQAIAESTRSGSFPLSDILTKRCTIYLILPPERVTSLSPLLRLWTGAVIRTAYKAGLQEKRKIHVICDEFSLLGKHDSVANALRVGRGMGLRFQLYVQDISQLKAAWKDGAAESILASCTKIFAAINDLETAKYVSDSIGSHTVIVNSGGKTLGSSSSRSDHGGSSGASAQKSKNWSVVGRKLITQEELLCLSPRTCIVLAPGLKPLWATTVRYYEAGFQEVIRMLPRSSPLRHFWTTLLFLAVALFLAVCATNYCSRLKPDTFRSRLKGL